MTYSERKQQQSIEAQKRRETHDALTLEQKIAKAKTRPGNSKKEISRLEQLIIDRDEKLALQQREALNKKNKGAKGEEYSGRTKKVKQ